MSLELQKLNHFKEFATDAGIAGVIAYINSGHVTFPPDADPVRGYEHCAGASGEGWCQSRWTWGTGRGQRKARPINWCIGGANRGKMDIWEPSFKELHPNIHFPPFLSTPCLPFQGRISNPSNFHGTR